MGHTAKNLGVGVVLGIVGLLAAVGVAVAGPGFINFQGRVLDGEGSPLAGPVDIVVGIFDAATDGTQLYHEEHLGTGLVDGVYSILIGQGTSSVGIFDADTFAADHRWLEVVIDGETLTPRQPFASVAYAFQATVAEHAATAGDADTVDGLEGADLDQSTDLAAHVGNTANPHGVTAGQAGAPTQAVYDAHTGDPAAHHAKTTTFGELTGQAADGQIPATIARDSEITWSNLAGIPAGFADGVDADSGGDITAVLHGTGLVGGGTIGDVSLSVEVPFHLSAVATGVIQGTHNTSGTYGYLAGFSYGVRGTTPVTGGVGVYGQATYATGANYGVQGRSDSTSGYGVFGWASKSSGTTYGVYGRSVSSSGRGVYGVAPSTIASTKYGGYFEAAGGYGRAVYGNATGTGAVTNYGGYFETSADSGHAVYGNATGTGAVTNYGGRFYAWGDSGRGVYGNAFASGDVVNYGGYFVSNGARGIGIYAQGGSNGQAAFFDGPDNDGTTAAVKINSGFQNMLLDGNEIDVVSPDNNLYLNHNSPGNVHIAEGGGRLITNILQINGADLSEHFDIHGAGDHVEPAPGMVVTIDPERPGDLIVSSHPYDRRVAGIIAGAGGIHPGVLMGQAGTLADGADPVALTGRVYCWADATDGPIKPGDLLTTAAVPGHAMKVTDRVRAQGAILGKAMSPLESGQGLVLVLVSLQ